jgi:alpha-beta hydrolase superfamily lysophospholipase
MSVESPVAVEVPVAQPWFIDVDGRTLFGWHHAAPSHLQRAAAIVLCPALGYEYMSAYRTWRILAERLAALGFDVWRFDYDGTGNSSGDCDDVDRVGAWLRSIAMVIAEARGLSSSPRLALVGLRAGALLALRAAAADGDIERLVLWSPFASGRAYVRELKATARLSHLGEGAAPDESAINAEGHLVTRDTAEALASWTVESVDTRPAREVLLLDRDDRSLDSRIETRLTALGSQVTRVSVAGTADMLMPPHLAQVPETAVDQVTRWFDEWMVGLAKAAVGPAKVADGPAKAADGPAKAGPHRRNVASGFSRTNVASGFSRTFTERAVRFGPDERLFGIITAPNEQTTAPSVILLNTGAGHHVGPHRLYVPLAREWAARGHVVFRFDLGGIGDSRPPGNLDPNIAYPAHMLDDAREAIAFIRREAPNRRVIVAGLCSGGWLAFRAARDGLVVDGVVSINPPLYLRDGDAGRQWVHEGRELERYQRSMRDPSKWMKALRGRASYATFTRMAATAIAQRMTMGMAGRRGTLFPDGLARDLMTIAERGVRILFVFSRGDNGLAYFQLHAQPALRRPTVRHLVDQAFIEDAGHACRPQAAQQRLRDLLTDFVSLPDFQRTT